VINPKAIAKAGLGWLGYEVRRLPRSLDAKRIGLGVDPFQDMRRITGTEQPVVFDVGANVGQSIRRFRTYFEAPVIHAFEPSSETFARLSENVTDVPDLRLNNLALGPTVGTAEFIENTSPVMSSLLEFGPDCWGEVKRRTTVTVSTLDAYCAEHDVARIDILKVDTQGFELEVLRGGEALFGGSRIGLIYMEIIFSHLYEGVPALDEVYRFLLDRGFVLVSFYECHHRNERAGWVDAMFAPRP
jgi:FkbM family methyltransferase